LNIYINIWDEGMIMFNRNHDDLPDRQSTRLQSYDYRQPGYYYITVCVANRRCVLSNIANAQVQLSPSGSIVQSEYNKLQERFQHVRLDQYVIMPNHFHGIIIFDGPPPVVSKDTSRLHIPSRFREYIDSAECVQSVLRDKRDATENNELPILGEVVRKFKAACTYRIRQTSIPDFAWEGRLYDHVIRNTPDLTRIRNYINNNPVSWQEDMLYRASLP